MDWEFFTYWSNLSLAAHMYMGFVPKGSTPLFGCLHRKHVITFSLVLDFLVANYRAFTVQGKSFGILTHSFCSYVAFIIRSCLLLIHFPHIFFKLLYFFLDRVHSLLLLSMKIWDELKYGLSEIVSHWHNWMIF